MEFPYNKEQKRVLTTKSRSSSSKKGFTLPGRVNGGTLLTAKMGCTGLQSKPAVLP